MTAILNRIFPLLFGGVTALLQFDDEGIFIELLIQTGFEFVQDRHSGANDIFGDFFVEHEKD